MSFRKAHGRAAKRGETLVWENAHNDPAPRLEATVAGAEIRRDAGGRIRSSEDARRLAQLQRHTPDFVGRKLAVSAEFSPYNRQRQEWTRGRVAELTALTGAVSQGVGARVRAAGWGFAFGEYLASRAAETNDPDIMDRAMTVLSKASVEDEKARRLAIDEANARRRNNQDSVSDLARALRFEPDPRPVSTPRGGVSLGPPEENPSDTAESPDSPSGIAPVHPDAESNEPKETTHA